jgi:hypothetical protein
VGQGNVYSKEINYFLTDLSSPNDESIEKSSKNFALKKSTTDKKGQKGSFFAAKSHLSGFKKCCREN